MLVLTNAKFITHYAGEKAGMFEVLGIIFGFISIFVASALGFIVAQFWFLFLNVVLKSKCLLLKRPHYKHIYDNYEKYRGKNELLSLMNYIISSLIQDEKMINYLQRRVDLFNTMASTGVSLVIGSIFGYAIKGSLLKPISSLETYISWDRYYCILNSTLLVIIIIFIVNMYCIHRENDSMVDILFRFDKSDVKKLNDILIFSLKPNEENNKKHASSDVEG